MLEVFLTAIESHVYKFTLNNLRTSGYTLINLSNAPTIRVREQTRQLHRVAKHSRRDQLRKLLGSDDLAGSVLALHLPQPQHVQAVVAKEDTRYGHHTPPSPEHARVVVALLLGDAQPTSSSSGNRQGPMPYEGVLAFCT